MLPSLAGQYEDALKKGDNVFLYLYSSSCSYCIKFDPIYKKLSDTYKDKCKFIKISTSTLYGKSLMKTYRARFVPYVLLINGKSHEAVNLAPACLLKQSCIESYLKDYTK